MADLTLVCLESSKDLHNETHAIFILIFFSGGTKRDKLKGTNAQNSQFFADFRRFLLIFAVPGNCSILEAQIFAENRRKPQIFAENRRKHLKWNSLKKKERNPNNKGKEDQETFLALPRRGETLGKASFKFW